MNDTVMNVLSLFGVATIFIIGAIVGGAIVINGVKKVIKFIFGKDWWNMQIGYILIIVGIILILMDKMDKKDKKDK